MAMFSVTTQDFEKTVIESAAPVLVEFTAPWCGYCRRLAPVLQRMSADEGMLPIAAVNIDEEPALAERFKVDTIPTLLVFEQGKLVRQAVGARPKAGVLVLVFRGGSHGPALVAPSTAAQIKEWLAGQEV